MRHEKKTITEKKGKNPTTQSKQKEIIYKTEHQNNYYDKVHMFRKLQTCTIS